MGTTVAGLLSLLISQVPPVRQFGITSASSIIAAMILSVTILPALLVKFDDDSYDQNSSDSDENSDRLESIVSKFTELVVLKKPIVVVGVVGILVLGGMYAYPSVQPNQEMMDFWPQELDEKKDIEMLSDTVESPKVVYVIAETDTAYSPKTFRELSRYQQLMTKNKKVNSVQSPVTAVNIANNNTIPNSQREIESIVNRKASQNNMIAIDSVSENPNSVLMKFYVDDIEGEPVRTLISEFDGNAEQTLTTVEDTRITGKPVVNRNVIENVTAGLTPMTLLSFTLGIIFLSFIFLSISTAFKLVMSVSGGTVLLVAGSMYIIGIPWNPLTITMSSLALGIGIDFGIHIYERYVEELNNGEDAESAISTSVSKLSRPILGSSLTTIFGFGVLNISRFPVLSNFGLTTDLAIAFALLSAFITLPAVLIVFRN
jgi:predicted RND superfamily exporter protein